MLDFTVDGTQVQCGFSLFDIATGEKTSLLQDGSFYAGQRGRGRGSGGLLRKPGQAVLHTIRIPADVGGRRLGWADKATAATV